MIKADKRGLARGDDHSNYTHKQEYDEVIDRERERESGFY